MRHQKRYLLIKVVYSCGLVLWTILLNGVKPWELSTFGPDSGGSIEDAKLDPARLVDIAVASVRDDGDVPALRLDEIRAIFKALLGEPEERSLQLLLQYQNE